MRLFFLLTLSVAVANGSYFVTYPRKWSSGDFTMAVSLLWINGSETQADVTLQLQPNGIRKELSGLRVGSTRKVTFSEAEILTGNTRRYDITITGKADGRELFFTQLRRNVAPRDVGILVQLNRLVYAPGDEVHFNVIGVYRNLLPYHGSFNVSVWNPVGLLVQSWKDVQAKNGAISLHFPLSVLAEKNRWRIHVEAERFQTVTQFTVNNNSRRTSELIVELPSYFSLDGSDDASVTITAWSRGQPRQGIAQVTVGTFFSDASIRMNVTLQISGTTNVIIRRNDILTLLNNYQWNQEGRRAFYVTVEVKDDQTARTVSHTDTIRLVQHRVKLTNVKSSQLKPGLHYHQEIRVSLADDQPLTAQDLGTKLMVTVTQASSLMPRNGCKLLNQSLNDQRFQRNYMVPASGVVSVDVPTSRDSIVLFVEARFGEVEFCHSVYMNMNFRLGHSLDFTANQSVARVGMPVPFTVETLDNITEVSYQVVSRGQLVEAGTAAMPRFLLTPSRAWGPVAHVIAYYTDSSNMIVHDMVSLPVLGYLLNEVTVTWSKATAMPGDNVSLEVRASDPGSFVGVAVSPYSTDGRASNLDMENTVIYQLDSDLQNWMHVKFEAAGLEYLLDGDLQGWGIDHLAQMGEVEQMGEMAPQPDVQVSNSEFWLWQTGILGPNRRSTFTDTVPGINTVWEGYALSMSNTNGLGLAKTGTQLKVFSPLHISMNVPEVAILGEEFIVVATVFNNQETGAAEVVATLQESDANFTVLFPSAGTVANQRGLVVPAGELRTASFAVSLLVVGEVSFTVVVSYQGINYTVTARVVVKFPGFPQTHSQSAMIILSPTNATFNFLFVFPFNFVDGSGTAIIYIYSSIMGPSIVGLENLLQMPCGCGEQTMIYLAPGIYIRIYLELTMQITISVREKSQNYMTSGYQRELTFARNDGSFSAFGNRDSVGSTWLTAFVLRSLMQARRYISVDEQVVFRARNFLLGALLPSGKFVERGNVIHKELQGGSAGAISLTAYTLLAFLEDPTANTATYVRSVQFLEANVTGGGAATNLPLALTAYALALANSSHAGAALALLNARATEKDGLKFWEDTTSGQLQYSWQPSAVTIEATAYALLAHLHQGKVIEGTPIMKWLSQQRNHLGGYSSTQDTVVALQALSEFTVASSMQAAGAVTVSAPGLGVPRTFQLTGTSVMERHSIEIPPRPNMNVTLSTNGSATIIAQLNVFYNVHPAVARRSARAAAPVPSFELVVGLDDRHANGSIGEMMQLKVCTSWKGDGESGMALMEVNLLSGFVAAKDQIVMISNLKLVEESPGKLYLYLVKLTGSQTCVFIPHYRVAFVAKAKEGSVAISDYYEPRRRVERVYSSAPLSTLELCSLCGPDCARCKSNVKGGGDSAVVPLLPRTVLWVAVLTTLGQAWLGL
ncbi:CD109 antigen-like isoform X1 [Petromyzon marinus]|uniref:CD109 antigen-like isoform X1 n=1 Tax=Petromyzon marinus TaxID=7757 RepID=UPI003F6ED6CE